MKNIDFSPDEILAWEPCYFRPDAGAMQSCSDNGCTSCKKFIAHQASMVEQIRAFFSSGRRTLLDIMESGLDDQDKRWVLEEAASRGLIPASSTDWDLDQVVSDLRA